MKKRILIALCALLPMQMLLGAGYQLNLQGLRQLAMGGGGTAIPWDASVIFYNPGALSKIEGIQVYGGVCFIMPNVEYAQTPVGNYTARSQSDVFLPFNIYICKPLRKDSTVWNIGLGIYTPFGSGITWDDNWTGRYVVRSIKLQTIFIQPTASYRINERLSAGLGLIFAYGNLDLKQALPVQDALGNDGSAHLTGNATGFGFNAGVHYQLNEKLLLGLSYRSQVTMKLNSGDATFKTPSSLTDSFPNTSFSTELPLPQVLSIGAAYRVIPKLLLQLDLNFTGWSAFDSLKIDFSKHTSSLQDNHAPRLYNNTLAIRLGAAYELNEDLTLMGGVAIDPTPVHDGYVSPDLPDANRMVLTCGFSYRPTQRLCIMAAFEYTASEERDSKYNFANMNGLYQTKAVTPGIGITYNF